MTPSRSLAAAQTVPVRGHVAANLDQHLELARVASAEGARVVVFPELSLTGYELDLAGELALSEDDPRLAPLADAARASATALVVGAPVRVGPRLHIGAFVLAPDGPAQVYAKRHLGAFSDGVNPGGPVPPAEATVFEPGEGSPVVDLGGGTAAVAVCSDVAHASHAEEAARDGAGVFLASMFVVPSDLEDDTARLRSYAARHAMPVVFSNFGGPSGGLPSAGRSAVWSEEGELLARLEDDGAGVAVAVEGPDGWRADAIVLGG